MDMIGCGDEGDVGDIVSTPPLPSPSPLQNECSYAVMDSIRDLAGLNEARHHSFLILYRPDNQVSNMVISVVQWGWVKGMFLECVLYLYTRGLPTCLPV